MWYEVVLQADDNVTFLVTAPDFPEVTSFGDTQPDACARGRAAIEEAIAARISRGEDIPPPLAEARAKGMFVQMSALTFLKAALYMVCKEAGISRAELAKRLGWHREQVDRLFRIDHNSKLDQIEAAFKAVGVPSIFNIPLASAA
jgi:antitoxin HicB